MENQERIALALLRERLQGAFITHFTVGDWWSFSLSTLTGGCWLVAYNITSDDEVWLDRLIRDHYSLYDTMVDKEYIAKCTLVAASMRRLITEVTLDEKYNLTLEFELGGRLLIPVSESIVDWQWYLNETGSDPYHDCLVGCFEGEISVSQK